MGQAPSPPTEAVTLETARGSPSGENASGRTRSIELFGQRFNVVSDADEGRVREVVAFLNDRLETIREGSKRVQVEQIALLAALNIAEELFEERDRSDRLRRKVRERSVRLLASIDAVSRDLDAKAFAALDTPPEDDDNPASLPGT